jgi:putative ubiquitin-RnfH superfamily antitoxin RatB of RatAB toxin-antitoxin module
MAETILVEVAYAEPLRQFLRKVQVARGTTALQAIEASGVYRAFPDIDRNAKLGIFGQQIGADAVLSDGDRVEIYRPLQIDPKDARRKRAAR